MNDCKGNVYQIGMGCCVPVIANPNAYYTKSEVDEKISEIETEGISEERAQELIDASLTDYYTKAEVDGLVDNLEDTDTALGGRIDTLSQDLTTEALRASTAESGLDTKIDNVNNTIQTQIQSIETELSGDYATKEYVGNYTYDKDTIDEKISEGGTFDPTQYYTKTATDTLLNDKADKSTTYTKTEVDTALSAKANSTDLTNHTSNTDIHVTSAEKSTWNGKQDALSSGSNIKTINGESILGSGDITISGGNSGFIRVTNPSSSSVGLVNSLSVNYSPNIGSGAIIEGSGTDVDNRIIANGTASHAEGINTKAIGGSSHAEGSGTEASGQTSHAEGINTKAIGGSSHAEGINTTASGISSHAEGGNTTASGADSHAEGYGTQASGDYSHAEGFHTVTNNIGEHTSGSWNVSVTGQTTDNTLFSVGNGTEEGNRHNAFEIRQNGDIYLTLDGQDVKLQDQLGGGFIPENYYDKTATDTLLNAKADKATTYTKTEVDTTLSTKANSSDVYTKTATDTLLNAKADKSTTYTKTEVDTALASKANSSDLTSHTSNTGIHVTSAEKTIWNNKSDFSGDYEDLTNKPTIPTYTAGNGITITNNVISAKVWSGTKAQYEALTNKDADCIYLIYEA